ncbi:exfoliative toxin [Streptococcus pyogenes]|nr:exfoliative toxin [Streptococcus pyogenes]
MIDLKRSLFKIDVRAQKDEEKVFMRTACYLIKKNFTIICT